MNSSLVNRLALVLGLLVLAIGGPWLVGSLRGLPGRHALSARAGQRIVTLEVGGMTCDACAAAVQGKLGAVAGVSAVEVRYPQRRAYVVCSPAVPDSALVAAVHAAGPGFFGDVVDR